MAHSPFRIFHMDSLHEFTHNAGMSIAKTPKAPLVLLLLAACLFVGLFFTLNALRYRALFAFEWGDEATHNQLAYRTFRHGLFTSTLKGDLVFDQHFLPAWALVAAAYIPFPHIYAWYFLEVASFAGAAIALFFWTLKRRNDPWGALLYALIVFFYPPIHQLAIGVYDPEKFSILFMMLMLLAFQRRRAAWFAVFAVLTLCCKEILAFTVLLFAVMLAVARKPARWWAPLAGLSAAWMIVAFKVIIPAIMDVGYGPKYFPPLFGADCTDFGCVILSAIQHPVQSLQTAFSFEHLRILALLFIPLAGAVFFAPILLIPALASLSMILSVPGNLLVNQEHWFAPAMPFLLAGTVAGGQRLSSLIGKGDPKKVLRIFRALPVVILILCTASSLFYGFVGSFHDDPADDETFKGLRSVFDRRIYTVTERDRQAWRLIWSVPKDAKVTSNYDLMPPLATRKVIREFGRKANNYDYFDFDYILINLKDRYFGAGHDVRLHPEDLAALKSMVESSSVTPLYSDENFFFGRRAHEGEGADAATAQNALDDLDRALILARSRLATPGVMDIRD